MGDMPPFLQHLVLSSPFWVLGLLALVSTHPNKRRKGERRLLRNRYAHFGILLLGFAIIFILIAYFGFGSGGCVGGITEPVTCAILPDGLGGLLLLFGLVAAFLIQTFGLLALGCYVLAEAISRWRSRKL